VLLVVRHHSLSAQKPISKASVSLSLLRCDHEKNCKQASSKQDRREKRRVHDCSVVEECTRVRMKRSLLGLASPHSGRAAPSLLAKSRGRSWKVQQNYLGGGEKRKVSSFLRENWENLEKEKYKIIAWRFHRVLFVFSSDFARDAVVSP
jgi:hypothetical protein